VRDWVRAKRVRDWVRAKREADRMRETERRERRARTCARPEPAAEVKGSNDVSWASADEPLARHRPRRRKAGQCEKEVATRMRPRVTGAVAITKYITAPRETAAARRTAVSKCGNGVRPTISLPGGWNR
jgi:hypothetical protein